MDDSAFTGYTGTENRRPGELPNDMQAAFGGPAWEWVPEVEQYYFHQFAPQQPDLNWDNPALRREIYDMILWWMDQGVEGFRLDVIDQIAKDSDRKITGNGPRLHEFLRELSAETFQKGCLVTVGEAWGADIPRARLYSAPDGSELSMVFQFEQRSIPHEKESEQALDRAYSDYGGCAGGMHCGNSHYQSVFLRHQRGPECKNAGSHP